MNRTKQESVASEVEKRIFRHQKKTIWSFADFSDLPASAVAAALSRLSRIGQLRRVRRGIYYRPRKTAFGESRPAAGTIADAVFSGRHSIPIRGYNRLGLTTQVANELHRAVDRPTRIKPIRGIAVRTVTRPISHQKGIKGDERLALDALRNIRRIPDASTYSTIKRIKSLITNKQLSPARLTRYARTEPPRVRALVGAIVDDLGYRGPAVTHLRRTLNPLTSYRVKGLAGALTSARAWHIK
jgi:hypothetical protein